MTKIEKASQMKELVRKWKESDLSQRAFAHENGLKLAKLRYWIRQQHNLEPEGPGFIQIGGSSVQAIGLRFPNGVELSLPLHTPVNLIRSLVQAF
jgi:hypothetical protein